MLVATGEMCINLTYVIRFYTVMSKLNGPMIKFDFQDGSDETIYLGTEEEANTAYQNILFAYAEEKKVFALQIEQQEDQE